MNKILPLQRDENKWTFSDNIVEINWSENNRAIDYYKLSNDYYLCGFVIVREIMLNPNNEKSDMWFLASTYMLRQSLELLLKAMIYDCYGNQDKVESIFRSEKHNLPKLYNSVLMSYKYKFDSKDKNWLCSYFNSILTEDFGSDLFRYPLTDKFYVKYGDNFLDIHGVSNNLIIAYDMLDEYYCSNESSVTKPDNTDFLVLGETGCTNNCYLWRPKRGGIVSEDYYPNIKGFLNTAGFLFSGVKELPLAKRFFPIAFLMRVVVELQLKQILKLEYVELLSVPNLKFKTHKIYSDLWKSVKAIIQTARHQVFPIEEIEFVDHTIKNFERLDKFGDFFRYPCDYNHESHSLPSDRFYRQTIDLQKFTANIVIVSDFLEKLEMELDYQIHHKSFK